MTADKLRKTVEDFTYSFQVGWQVEFRKFVVNLFNSKAKCIANDQIIPEYHYWKCRITKILFWPETVYPSPEYINNIFIVVIIAYL